MSEANGFTTAEELLQTLNAKRLQEVTIGGNKFLLSSITAGDFAEVQALAPPADANEQKKRRALLRMQARLIYHVFVKQDGSKLLTMDQAEKLSDMDARMSQSMFTAAAEHAGIDETELEKLAKNSDAASTASSPTA